MGIVVKVAMLALMGMLAGCGGGRDSSPPATEQEKIALGQRLNTSFSCHSCHSNDGTRLAGPSYKGIAGKPVELATGATVVRDREYLITAILHPNVQVVKGYPASMPPYDKRLKPWEAEAIAAYIETIR